MYEAIFYDDPKTGKEPVRIYLDSLDDGVSGYVYEVLRHVEEKGRLPSFPLASHIEGSIWELRFHKQGAYQRILYAVVVGSRLLLLEGFTKTTRETPKKHKKIARERFTEFLKRSENQRKHYAKHKKKK